MGKYSKTIKNQFVDLNNFKILIVAVNFLNVEIFNYLYEIINNKNTNDKLLLDNIYKYLTNLPNLIELISKVNQNQDSISFYLYLFLYCYYHLDNKVPLKSFIAVEKIIEFRIFFQSLTKTNMAIFVNWNLSYLNVSFMYAKT
ncbi:MAG: hypothetical protein IPG79_14360 [Saprospiraceae bacterium]|nr:hypothetical protein [Saprospiraceae bacterium]